MALLKNFKIKAIFVACFMLICISSFCNAVEDVKVARARVDSCPGCRLNSLPEVRAFIYEDVPKYENVEWKKIQGAPPELVFLNEADEEIERYMMDRLSREDLNDLLKSKGFPLKEETKQKEL